MGKVFRKLNKEGKNIINVCVLKTCLCIANFPPVPVWNDGVYEQLETGAQWGSTPYWLCGLCFPSL